MTTPADARTRLVGLVGEGISTSLTPPMHEREGARHGFAYVYRTIELTNAESGVGALHALLESARRLGFDGLNVTHPVKRTVMGALDRLAPSATAVGAVNTVLFTADGAVGHNTDVTGFAASLSDAAAGRSFERAVLVGAGGAGCAVAAALADRGIARLTIVDEDTARAAELADTATGVGEATTRMPEDAEEALRGADLVINATPVGMAHLPGCAIDVDLLSPTTFVADVVYRPVETELITRARARGCTVMTGLGMAMHQAADAFELFTSETADRRAMLADLTEMVAAEAAATTAPAAPMKGQEQ
ncbi:shikimate dehydrogenase [Demequina sp. NBRC 110056]|uniref:shikimate dehydrogenase n=1 Tax=Demequina sp. NBRC 110056 TaxID=1570345 RepID=UPI0009FF9F2B|nr:shikimate dehydrogenase [Demequina sp. NBRC 110056]